MKKRRLFSQKSLRPKRSRRARRRRRGVLKGQIARAVAFVRSGPLEACTRFADEIVPTLHHFPHKARAHLLAIVGFREGVGDHRWSRKTLRRRAA